MHRCSLFSLWPDGVKKAVRALHLTPKAWKRKNVSLSFFISPFQNEQVFSRAVLSNPNLHFMAGRFGSRTAHLCIICDELLLGTSHLSTLSKARNLWAKKQGKAGWSYPKWLFQFDFCLPSIKCPSTDPVHRCETSHVRLNFIHYTFGDASIQCIRYVFFCLYDICHPLSIICEVYFERQTS